MNHEKKAMESLAAMLSYCRPHGSKSERRFIERFIKPLGVSEDEAGNMFKLVGDASVLWSCHTDSVHRNGGNQQISIARDMITLPKKTKSTCLGADCATGVWIMREMILAKRPGLYVFHRAEEQGGKGSAFIAKHRPRILDDIKYAIAFDRFGTKSVITHQAWGRCCSDVFANALGDAIGLGMKPDDTGSFTDTANYVDLIGECTNISVGYFHHHTASETQDTAFAMALREAMLTLDTDTLPALRKPGEQDDRDLWRYSYSYAGREDVSIVNAPSAHARRLMEKLVSMNPLEIADMLEDYGLTTEDVAQYVYERGGAIPTELYS